MIKKETNLENNFFFEKNSDFEETWNKVKNIPGYITKYEGYILYLLSKTCGSLGNILELGSYHGKSSLLLAKGLVDGKHSSKVFCIDNFIKQSSSTYPSATNPKLCLQQNMHSFNLNDKYVLEESDSISFLNKLTDENYGLIFIDSEHSKKQISKEFPLVIKRINSRGVIAIHDYMNSNVEKEYSDWLLNNVVSTFDTLYIRDSTKNHKGNGLLLVNPQRK